MTNKAQLENTIRFLSDALDCEPSDTTVARVYGYPKHFPGDPEKVRRWMRDLGVLDIRQRGTVNQTYTFNRERAKELVSCLKALPYSVSGAEKN